MGMRIGGNLRRELLLALVGLALLSSVLLGAVAVYRLDWELYEQLVRRGRVLARFLAQEAFYSAYIQGERDLVPLAEGALRDDVIFIEIVKEGEVLGQAGSPPTEPYLEIWQAILDSSLSGERRRSADEPIGPYLPTNSYVRLAISLDYLAYEMRREFLWLGLAGLGIALVALTIAWLLSGVILRPLQRVKEALEAFGQGRLHTRAPVEREDELGELARAFNRMAEAIVEMRGELERASRAKSEFITLMGHELRTPLNVLLGYIELLLAGVGGDLTEEQRSYLAAAMRSGEHLQALLGNVLQYAKLELGVERLHPEPVALNALAAEVVEGLRPYAEEKRLSLTVKVEPRGLTLEADRTKLRQIVFNLLQNAIRHSPPGGGIELGASLANEEEERVRLWVRDEGPGIPREERERVFEPFVRLEAPSAPAKRGREGKEREGLGLGLAVVQRYAQLHGGRAWVESPPDGGGSVFLVELPLRTRAPIPERGEELLPQGEQRKEGS